jgi:hypothetical protein
MLCLVSLDSPGKIGADIQVEKVVITGMIVPGEIEESSGKSGFANPECISGNGSALCTAIYFIEIIEDSSFVQ